MNEKRVRLHVVPTGFQPGYPPVMWLEVHDREAAAPSEAELLRRTSDEDNALPFEFVGNTTARLGRALIEPFANLARKAWKAAA